MKVNYVEKMLPFNPSTWHPDSVEAESQVHQLLCQKYIDWKYEEEYRIWVGLDEKDEETGHYFLDFTEKLVLREVILGARCTADRTKIKNLLNTYKHRVEITKAKTATNSYTIVRDRKYKIMASNA